MTWRSLAWYSSSHGSVLISAMVFLSWSGSMSFSSNSSDPPASMRSRIAPPWRRLQLPRRPGRAVASPRQAARLGRAVPAARRRPAPRSAEPDTGPGGYLDRLEEAGHGPITWTEHLRARMPEADEADLLQIAVRAVVIELARVGISAKSREAVEVTVCVIPADRVEIIMPLLRDRSARWDQPAPRE
jgi:hypothetical protein